MTFSGASLEIDVEADAKLEDLRTALYVRHAYKADSYELFLNEKVLPRNCNACDLTSLGISENTLVTVVRKQVRPAVNMCFLNTAFLNDDLVRVVRAIRRLQENAPEAEPLLIIVSYLHAEEETRNHWFAILKKKRLAGVCYQYIIPEGVLVLSCNVKRNDACSFLKMECHEIQDQLVRESNVHFGGLICSVEIRMKLEGERFYDMDVMWTPYIAGSKRGFLLNNKSFGDAVEILHARRMFSYGQSRNDDVDFETVAQRYRRSFGACIMVTHVSDVPLNEKSTKTMATWHAHGRVRVIEGFLENGNFIHDKGLFLFGIQCLRMRPRRHHGKFPECHRLSSLTNTFWLDETIDTSAIEAEKAPEDFVGTASGATSSCREMPTQDVAADVEPEIDNVCIVCLDFEPFFVLSKCGHFGICSNCRTSMYLRQNNRNHGCEIPKAKVKWKSLFDKHIICPYCRTSTKTVHRSRFTGKVYSCG